MVIIIPVAPVPKPRMTRNSSWKPAAKRYFKYKDDLLSHVQGELEPRFMVRFNVPMPKSWSKKERAKMLGMPHQSKPDVDNYLKAFMDALSSADQYIYDVRAVKYWAESGSIELEEYPE